jgi:hypothetical protein
MFIVQLALNQHFHVLHSKQQRGNELQPYFIFQSLYFTNYHNTFQTLEFISLVYMNVAKRIKIQIYKLV